MMLHESCGSALNAMVSLFSGPRCRVAVDAIRDVNALGVSVLGAPDAAEAAIAEILGLSKSDADATAYADLRNRAAAAQQAMSSIDALDSILSNAQTGKMEEAMAIAGQFLGTEAGANFQATQALVNERVFELINSLKGPATDKDAERAQAQIPNMGTDPRARKVVFDYLRKKAGQQVEVFQDADTFLRERGNLQGWVPRYGSFSVDTAPLGAGPDSGSAQPSPQGGRVRTWTPDGGVR